MTTTIQPTTKKKPGCFVRLLRFLIIIGVLLAAAYLAYLYGLPYYMAYRDQYVSPQPIWDPYDPEDTELKFALLKINDGLAKKLDLNSDDAFLLNRLSVFGDVPNIEECSLTKYKCGDGKWQSFEGDSVLLDNRCIVKIARNKTCTLLLPDGSLITATNYYKYMEGAAALFSEKNLQIQVVMTEDEIKIKQGVTPQLSALWHLISPTSEQTYVVELGDESIRDIGTVFGTYNSMLEKSIAVPVKKGSVQVENASQEKPVAVPAGSYYYGLPYDTTQCPAPLKVCGKSCVPGNAVCCSELSGSYCLSPLACGENYSGKCSTSFFSGEKSNYCCVSSNKFADQLTIMQRGSYDCRPGMKFCGMTCIAQERPCCYPTDEDCVDEELSEYEINPIKEDTIIPREYFNNAYIRMLASPSYQAITGSPDFLQSRASVNTVRLAIQDSLKDQLAKEYQSNNAKEETRSYCNRFPSHCHEVKPANNSGSSGGGNCPSSLPSDLKCSCGSRDANGWVPCNSNQAGSAGTWSIPLNCLKAKGICK